MFGGSGCQRRVCYLKYSKGTNVPLDSAALKFADKTLSVGSNTTYSFLVNNFKVHDVNSQGNGDFVVFLKG